MRKFYKVLLWSWDTPLKGHTSHKKLVIAQKKYKETRRFHYYYEPGKVSKWGKNWRKIEWSKGNKLERTNV